MWRWLCQQAGHHRRLEAVFFMNRWHPAAENDRLPTMWATYHTAEMPAKALKTRWRFDAYSQVSRGLDGLKKGSIEIAGLEVQWITRDIFLPNVCRHHGELACGFNVFQLFSSHSEHLYFSWFSCILVIYIIEASPEPPWDNLDLTRVQPVQHLVVQATAKPLEWSL